MSAPRPVRSFDDDAEGAAAGKAARMDPYSVIHDTLRSADGAAPPDEYLWELTKEGGRLRCELRNRGDLGCQVQLLRDGKSSSARLFPAREVALASAEETRVFFAARGWTLSGPSTGD